MFQPIPLIRIVVGYLCRAQFISVIKFITEALQFYMKPVHAFLHINMQCNQLSNQFSGNLSFFSWSPLFSDLLLQALKSDHRMRNTVSLRGQSDVRCLKVLLAVSKCCWLSQSVVGCLKGPIELYELLI